MLKHHLLLAFRNFKRNKSSFFINLIGLSTGLACVLLIYLWVADEIGMDRFHKKEDQIYQFLSSEQEDNEIYTYEGSPLLMTESIVKDYPEVEAAVSVSQGFCSPRGILSYGNTAQKSEAILASEDFFKVFSFDLLLGEESQVLSDKSKIVLSEELARKLFETPEAALGKSLQWNYQWDGGVEDFLVTVSGVFKSIPSNSSMQFDAVGHAELIIDADRYAAQWNSWYVKSYLQLGLGTDVEAFNLKIGNYLNTKGVSGGDEGLTSFVQKFSERYLQEPYVDGKQVGGRITQVKLITLLAILILIIACINFMNMSTAQGSMKMKEIGVKKSLGVNRRALAWQFLSESMLVVIFSLLVAGVLVLFLLPQFNQLTGKHILLSLDQQFVTALLGLAMLTGLMAGCYPAFYLSGFSPANVFRAKVNPKASEGKIRKGLVVFQFSLSIILIFAVVVISKQLDFVMNKNLGYNKHNLVTFEMGSNNDKPIEFIEQLNSLPGVTSASFMSGSILVNHDNTSGFSWNGAPSNEDILFQAPRVGYDFVTTMGMELVAGRDFSREFNDTHERIILNESAVKFMGLTDPVGHTIKFGKDQQREIIGVVNDFHYGSLHKRVEPLILRFREHGRNVMVRMVSGSEIATLTSIEKLYKQFQPDYLFEYSFINEDYQELYNSETSVAVLTNYFATLAILISCLGLFGLSTFTAERRAKEIGIRKVMGSSVLGIVRLMSSDFTKMVLMAIVIGLPLAYWSITAWLKNFAYTTTLEWWYFVAAAGFVLLVAWSTVGLQTLKAALENPTKVLRSE